MATEVRVPELPESVSEATVGEWQKNKGEAVQRDENLVDLETDKVVLEVPAVADGVLAEIKVAPGDTVAAGDVLAIFDEGATADAGGAADDAPTEDADGGEAADEQPKPAAADAENGDAGADAPASPAAQKLMNENDITASDVKGTGKDGRITKADVVAAIDKRHSAPAEKPAKSGATGSTADDNEQVDRQALAKAPQERLEQRVPMTRIRARIAERLLEATQNTAML
ncbi:MAG: E3 binding domain-containing protein, partial [Sinobacteraceae bacterium]|nr:E3 binding domain-containing protein [Nevskiaceae bacterium]